VKAQSATRTTRRRTAPHARQPSLRPRLREDDAIALLSAEHAAVCESFERLSRGHLSAAHKSLLVREICTALRIHMLLEEEILYPAARRAVGGVAHTEQARARHVAPKALLARLVSMRPGSNHYNATVAALGEYIRFHVEREHGELFPRVRASGLNLRSLGDQLRLRKRALASATVVLGEVLTTGP
jgi:hypothetical protein